MAGCQVPGCPEPVILTFVVESMTLYSARSYSTWPAPPDLGRFKIRLDFCDAHGGPLMTGKVYAERPGCSPSGYRA